MVHAEQPENRNAYAFKPTNEKPFATFLVDRNDQSFFDFYICEQEFQLFSRPNTIDAMI